jgi:hypothetical protein
VLSYRFLELTHCQSGTPEYNVKLTNVEIERWLTIRTKAASRVKIQIRSQANTVFNSLLEFLLGSPMVFAADRAFNDLLRNYGKRTVVDNPLFD